MRDVRQHNLFAASVAERLQSEPFLLAAIGVDAGALENGWRSSFGSALSILVLAQSLEQGRAVLGDGRGSVLAADFDKDVRVWDNPPFGRFSDARARYLQAQAQTDQPIEPLADWLSRQSEPSGQASPADLDYEAAYVTAPTPLTDAIDAAGFGDADFLRLDAGWSDYAVLNRLGAVLERPTVLGLTLKAHLHGSHAADENTFHNIDRLMRRRGFELFQLEPAFHSSAALPWPFLDRHPDQTEAGRTVRAKALYLRDHAGPAGRGAAARAASIAKAAAVRALHGLPDQAAELLLSFRDILAGLIDVDAGLDLLALQIQEDQGSALSYRDYIDAFEAGRPTFYNLHDQRARWMESLRSAAREAPIRIAAIQDRLGQLASRVRSLELAAAARPLQDGDPDSTALDIGAHERERLAKRSVVHPPHHWVFDCFSPWRGVAAEPSVIDFIGSRTALEVGQFKPLPVGVELQLDPPSFDEEYFEWTDVLEAVLDAGDTFTMLELGAGYGRWSVRAALAAARLGKTVRLGLAEAEPKHIQWLKNHMARNGVEPSSYEIFPFAVGGSAGEVVFTVGTAQGAPPENWFGQSIVEASPDQRPRIGDYYGAPLYEAGQWTVIVVPQRPLSDILRSYAFVDLIDMDLQGAEAEAVPEAVADLTRIARRLHIGTHGHDIEARLREVLGAHGWICLQDFACHTTQDTPYGPVGFVDGVQSWINPKLWHRRS